MPKRRFEVYRGGPDGGGLQSYEVECDEGMVVLDAMHRLQAEQAGDLALRWNCKAGKCGSCSAEINGHPKLMCMTRLSDYPGAEPVTVTPMRAFPIIRDLVADVSWNYQVNRRIPEFQPRAPDHPDGTWTMHQYEVERAQEFRKCIECFLCQDVCHVLRTHGKHPEFIGPAFLTRAAAYETHPLDTADRTGYLKDEGGIGYCNITQCCTEVCPEGIRITDNAIIPLKERVVDRHYDPLARLLSKLFALALALGLTAAPPAATQERPAVGAGAQPGAVQDTGLARQQAFAALVRDAVARRGFIDTYQKGDKLYAAIPPGFLGRDFLMTQAIARGIGSHNIFGGTMLEGMVLAFERRGDRLLLMRRNTRFTAPAGSPAARAVELSFGGSAIASARIEATREDSALVVDLAPILVSDFTGLGERLRTSLGTRTNLDRDRSAVERVAAYPRNVSVEVALTYTPSEFRLLTTVPDSRYITVGAQYNFAALPERPMTPRLADDRVGYFLTVVKDFSRDDRTFWVRYVNRWRLEKRDPGAAVSDAVQPITFYLDRNIPEVYRPYIREGVAWWQRAFEAAGFRNAIVARDAPDDSAFDPADLRYATIRWNASSEPGYGAIGPSRVDPRTGEILDADILMEANLLLGYRHSWRTYVSPAAAAAEVMGVLDAAPEVAATELGQNGASDASLGAEIAAQGGLLRAVLVARGAIGPGEPVPMPYLGEALRWVTAHEVGHTLGLRHNFRGSTDTPFERLHDRSWAEANGLVNSVMEYPGINLGRDPRQQGYYYSPTVGTNDRWRILYGYVEAPDDSLRAIAAQAARSGHAYGTDDDANGPGVLDPLTNVYDLSADPLTWAEERTALIAGLWAGLERRVLAPGDPYVEMRDALRTLLVQYSRALAIGVKYVGGRYHSRSHLGDPGDRGPFAVVTAAESRRALNFLADRAFSDRAFAVPPEVLRRLGADRWSHWGHTSTTEGRIDYPFAGEVLTVQRTFLEGLTQPLLLARMHDNEIAFGESVVLTMPEVFGTLTRTIYAELMGAGPRNVGAMRRDLQRAWLDRLVGLTVTPPAGTPADARSVARATLADLGRRADRAARSPGLNAYTRAHLGEVSTRIRRALEARLEVEATGR